MSSILTFLGKGGTGRTTIAIAAARKLAARGSKVLFIGQDPSPVYSMALGIEVTSEPQEISPNLSVVQIQSTALLEQSWEQAKKLEQQYLRSPILKNVYGQELAILPGMDEALALNSIREYYQSNKYDAIIYDGSGDTSTLRMFGIPANLGWYVNRFRGVFQESDIVKALSPFVQPVTSAILNTPWKPENLAPEPMNQAGNMLDDGKKALADPKKVISYLVTTSDPVAVATAKYLWGGAQQVGLTVGGVLLNQGQLTDDLTQQFSPLPLTLLPRKDLDNEEILIDALPNFQDTANIPQPTTINIADKKIRVFLPGFTKKQVKLTQYGGDITIEAGEQRRNITLPPQWSGRSVTGAKFNNSYLELTIG